LDARGTPGRSKAFHDSVYGNWNAGVPDHVGAMRQLCKRHSWMDADRVGIVGHSWGGYYATYALANAPDVYHAAVAYSPGYDPWDNVLYEPYLGMPRQNRAAYEQADLSRQADKIKRPLLIASGTSDNVLGSVMKMTRALIEAGICHELVIVPEAFHHFTGHEEDYFLMKLIHWFDRYVKNRGER
jgi:dipeptidyl aminopeptidase/acylaminoacyl peptidase